MKKIILIIVSLFLLLPFSYADTTDTESTIKAVTLFFNGAQINRNVQIELSSGQHMLRIEKLPEDLSASSIQLKAPTGVEILSIKHEKTQNKISKKTQREIELIREEERIKKKIDQFKDLSSVYSNEYDLLMDNTKLSTAGERVPIQELKEAADFYRSRLTELINLQEDIKNDIEKEQDKLRKIYREQSRIKIEKAKPYSHLLVMVDVKEKGKKTMNLSYYTPKAGWSPSYDIRVSDISSPLLLVTKANIFQHSGEEWKDVKLELSTADPKGFSDVPSLKTWFIGSSNSVVRESSATEQKSDPYSQYSSLRGKIKDQETDEPLPFANVVLKMNDTQVAGGSTDFDGNYELKKVAPGYYDLYISIIGYSPKMISGVRLHNNKITFQDVQMSAGVELEEFNVVEYTIPLIDRDGGSSGGVVTSEDISKMSMRSTTSRSYSTRVRGGRNEAAYYYIDGMKYKMPDGSIQSNDLLRSLNLQALTANTLVQEYSIEKKMPYPFRWG